MSLREEEQGAEKGFLLNRSPLRSLKEQQQVAQLIKRGQKITISNFSLWCDVLSEKEQRLMVIISSRAGNAVKRNKARRLVKEVVRLNKGRIKRGLHMAIKINAPLPDDHKDTERNVLRLLEKAGVLEKSADNIN